MASVKWDGGKYKGATEAKAHFRHNETEQRKLTGKHSNNDIDRSRTVMNFSVIGRSYAERCKMYDTAIEEAAAHSKRKLRADAVTCLGLCTYAPAELPEEKCAEWFTNVHSIMVEMFGAENVIDTDVHFDEVHEYYDSEQDELVLSRVHSHTNIIPRTADGRLCCKEIYTRANCVKLNGLIEDMTQRDYGIQFQTGAKTKGTKTVEQLKADTLKAALEEENRAREHRHELVVQNAELNKRNTVLFDELKKQNEKLDKVKETAAKIEETILRKQRIFDRDKEKQEKLLRLRSEEINRHIKEIKRIQSEYSKTLEDIRSILSTIKTAAERLTIEKKINESIRKRAKLTAELDEYVDLITKQQKNKDKVFSL
ncbi:Plasmid recombination enzyme [Ruminococcaceae bacterium FB2012]|nr:Plasmid recombination enzyme [Ruminococcaceae bacterium FB2012]